MLTKMFVVLAAVFVALTLAPASLYAQNLYFPVINPGLLPERQRSDGDGTLPDPDPEPPVAMTPLREGEYVYMPDGLQGPFMYAVVNGRAVIEAGFLEEDGVAGDLCNTAVGSFDGEMRLGPSSIHMEEYSESTLMSTMDCEILQGDQLSCVGRDQYKPSYCTYTDDNHKTVRGTLDLWFPATVAVSPQIDLTGSVAQNEANIKALATSRHWSATPN